MQHFMTNRFLLVLMILFASCSNKSNKERILIQKEHKTLSENKIDKDTIKKDTTENKPIELKNPKKFEDYKVKVYTGKLAKPNLTNNEFRNDKEYVRMISDGCERNKINFGGYYTIITESCGAQCASLFIINRKTGRIYTGINPNDGKDGFEFRKDSKLLIANANLFIDYKFEYYYKYFYQPEFYIWNGENFVSIK